ncbi:hypothetical protein ABG067_006631 [Albugo candida]|uniref:PH domain-containing protein n=1 Tax=Albugo candida TaxID=65357 RepID=A0A024FW28_9STRA|nr:unnamed protein product [Albugo candida]|eukprot:CCI10864.1 unnamed protein product [Albugo candida]
MKGTESSRFNHRSKSRTRVRQHNSNSVGTLNVDIELLVQSTQNCASLTSHRKSGGADRFHGWIWRRSGRFSKWKNEHFVLEGVLLSYFGSFTANQFVADSHLMPLGQDALLSGSQENTPTGVLRVAHVERSDKSRIAFKVYAISGKVIDLRAKNEHVCTQWVRRLNEAAMLGKRQEALAVISKRTLSSPVRLGLCDSEVDVCSNLVDKNGWLEVCEHKVQRKRYCVLQGGMITYYDTEDSWAVPLSRAYVSHVEMDSNQKEIQLETTEGRNINKLVSLRAKSVEDLHLWQNALRQAISCS